MLIAIDSLLLSGQFTGVQHAIKNITSQLLADDRHQYLLILPADADHIKLYPTANYQIINAPFKGNEKLKRIWWQQFVMPKLLKEKGVDLLFSPGYISSIGWRGKSAVLIHDTIALSHPELCSFWNAKSYRMLLPMSARHADIVITPSQSAANDVAQYCHVKAEKTRVVPLGVDQIDLPAEGEIIQARQRISPGRPYILAVSAIEPKKNFDSLIKWFDKWAPDIPHNLIIIGKYAWRTKTFKKALKKAKYSKRIIIPGYMEQADLPPIYAGADLFVMPSRYEGFGLPALEAMAVGTPTAVSDAGSLPEIAGDAAAVIPLNGDGWQTSIVPLLKDTAKLEIMRANGIERARQYTWQKTGEMILRVFDEIGRK
jgi:glycosyltransferase involved in cell wall biosynthesis